MNIIRSLFITIIKVHYHIVRPVIFLFDSENVHTVATHMGNFLGRYKFLRWVAKAKLCISSEKLQQTIAGITFENPVGLAAGFDYKAQLTQILPSLGFGFETIGTVTNQPYDGNPPPRLGRLPKSKSLMVNKGFKSEGIHSILKKLEDKQFDIPIGISIGKTNSATPMTDEETLEDIRASFIAIQNTTVPFSYYELNISCPNLYGNVNFYNPSALDKLITTVTSIPLKKPLFIKMPIEKDDDAVHAMLNVIKKHPVQGVIFGNLQKDRSNSALIQKEVKKYPTGNFSGMPTQKRSNELIKLAYRTSKDSLTIIGCGGIFSAEDAYQKIKLGASVVQLITGLVFEGPQLAAQINRDLLQLMKHDGFKNISEATGTET